MDGAEHENGKIVVHNVTRPTTVVVKTRQLAEVRTNATACEYELDAGRYVGDSATIVATADENYYIDKISINGIESEFELNAAGVATAEFVLESSNEIDCVALGRQVVLSVDENITATANGEEVESDTVHYGDKITLKAAAKSGDDAFGYMLLNGDKFVTDSVYEFSIENDTTVTSRYRGANSRVIYYDANGGEAVVAPSINFYDIGDRVFLNNLYDKASGEAVFARDGYVLSEYNTQADGSGEAHSLGAMILMPPDNMTLYCVWEKETEAEAFEYTATDSEVTITGMLDTAIEKVVIPERIEGKPVTTIASNAFSACKQTKSIHLNNKIRTLENDAFKDCEKLEKLTFFNNMTSVGEPLFTGSSLKTMAYNDTVGAFHDGRYSTIADGMLTLQNQNREPRVIIVSGSSGEHGINPYIFNREFNSEVLNLGHYASMNIINVLDIVSKFTIADDIVILSHEPHSICYLEDMGLLNTPIAHYHQWSNCDVLRYMDFSSDNLYDCTTIRMICKKTAGIDGYHVDEWGTFCGWLSFKNDESKTFKNAKVTYSSVDFESIDYSGLKRNAELIRDRDAKIYWTFPGHYKKDMTEAEEATYRAEQAEFMENIKTRIAPIMPIISDPKDYELPLTFMYDSIWHPTNYNVVGQETGAKIRTRRLIADINAQLEKEGVQYAG